MGGESGQDILSSLEITERSHRARAVDMWQQRGGWYKGDSGHSGSAL